MIFKHRKVGISGGLLKLRRSYWDVQFQSTLLRVQNSVKASVSQGSILEPVFFLVCINGACSNLLTDVKLFADDTSLFSAVNDASGKFENQSNDLCAAREWNY